MHQLLYTSSCIIITITSNFLIILLYNLILIQSFAKNIESNKSFELAIFYLNPSTESESQWSKNRINPCIQVFQYGDKFDLPCLGGHQFLV